jgi:hypothetical protein
LNWGFEGDSLGCRLREVNGGETAIITAGEEAGVVTVVATCESLGCVFKGDLELHGGGEGNCVGCGSGNGGAMGAAIINNQVGPDLRIGLGQDSPHRDSGFVWLRARSPSADLAKPETLQIPYTRSRGEVIYDKDAILRQIRVPQGLVHVGVVDDYKYTLQFFYLDDVGPEINGLYTTNASAFVYWTVENPDGASANNRLWVTEDRAGTTRRFKYTYSASDAKWDLVDDNNNRTLSSWEMSSGVITNIFQEIKAAGLTVQKLQKAYDYRDNNKVLKQVIEGDGSATRTTTYYVELNIVLSGVSAMVRPQSVDSNVNLCPNHCGYTAIELNRRDRDH